MMSYIDINSERCTRCGTCIDACPSDVLEIGGESSQVSHPERCISCGHCAAVCPEDAISSSQSNSRSPFTLEEIPTKLPPEQLLFHLKRSTREFTAQKLDKETIKTMVQYAEKAPSSHNFRQREYIVVTDTEKIQQMEDIVAKVYRSLVRIFNPVVLKMMGLLSKPAAKVMEEFSHDFKNLVRKNTKREFPVFRGAPCVMLIIAPKNYGQSRDDCVAAQNYMMLYAQSIGIGSCIIGYAQYAHKKLARYLKIPKDKQIFAISIFGYPRLSYKKVVRYRDPAVTWK